jgi:hypothetical protein
MGGLGYFYYQYAIHFEKKKDKEDEKIIPTLILLDRERIYTGNLAKNKWDSVNYYGVKYTK